MNKLYKDINGKTYEVKRNKVTKSDKIYTLTLKEELLGFATIPSKLEGEPVHYKNKIKINQSDLDKFGVVEMPVTPETKAKTTESDKLKRIKKAHKKKIEKLGIEISEVWGSYHDIARNNSGLAERNITLRQKVADLTRAALGYEGLIELYKKDLDRSLKVEAHYHDLVAENKKLKAGGVVTEPTSNNMTREDKLRKLRAIKNLAERGIGGEKEAAKLKLKKLSKDYGIPLSDIENYR